MTDISRTGYASHFTALLALALVSSCQTAPTTDQMARTTTEVAPADLQLLCASAAASAAKVDASKTLPTSSARIDDQTYSVRIDAAGAKYVCTVDVHGAVKSVTPSGDSES